MKRKRTKENKTKLKTAAIKATHILLYRRSNATHTHTHMHAHTECDFPGPLSVVTPLPSSLFISDTA